MLFFKTTFRGTQLTLVHVKQDFTLKRAFFVHYVQLVIKLPHGGLM